MYSHLGYKKNSPDINNPYNVIPSNRITMKGVNKNLLLIPMGNNGPGNPVLATPNEEYFFPDYTHVLEIPVPKGGKMNYQRMKQGGWLDKYQDGGQPTRQDSLDLYNNTMALLEYYGNKKNYKSLGSHGVPFDDITYPQKTVRDKMKKDLDAGLYPYTNRIFESGTLQAWNLAKGLIGIEDMQSGQGQDVDFTFDEYYQKINENQYKQRERQNLILDLEAPMPLYDKRIKPTVDYNFENVNDEYSGLVGTNPVYGDASTFYGYDPILIKPADLLTAQERAKRNKLVDNSKEKDQQSKVSKSAFIERGSSSNQDFDLMNSYKNIPIQYKKTVSSMPSSNNQGFVPSAESVESVKPVYSKEPVKPVFAKTPTGNTRPQTHYISRNSRSGMQQAFTYDPNTKTYSPVTMTEYKRLKGDINNIIDFKYGGWLDKYQ